MRPHSRPGSDGQPGGKRSRVAQAVQLIHELEPDVLGGVFGVGGLQPVPAADRPDQRGISFHQPSQAYRSPFLAQVTRPVITMAPPGLGPAVIHIGFPVHPPSGSGLPAVAPRRLPAAAVLAGR